jgi:phospholipid/cholesterol/gamma-HCH transport system substrate-binding protein
MFFDMDPGTKSAGTIDEGGTVPLENTAPDVNLDELLASLDSDTQAYLRLLLVGAGKGLEGRDKDLGKVLGSLGPLTKDLDRINSKVAERKENLRRLISNFNLLTKEVGKSEEALTELVRFSNTTVGAIAEQDPSVRRAIALLPGTLQQSTVTLNHVASFADQLGPALGDLRPFARNLDEVNASTKKLALRVTPVVQNQIRPFVKAARGPVRDLEPAAQKLAKATPQLTVVAKKINRLGNMAAYNPGGAEPPGTPGRDEGYLFFGAWLGHNSNSVFQVQDAHGVDRRIYLTIGCDEALSLLGSSPLAPAVTGLGALFDPGGPFAGAC